MSSWLRVHPPLLGPADVVPGSSGAGVVLPAVAVAVGTGLSVPETVVLSS